MRMTGSSIGKGRVLVDLLNLWPGAGATAAGGRGLAVLIHAVAGSLVHLGDDRVADALQLLHLVVEFVGLGQLVAVQPADGLVDGVLDFLLVGGGEFGGDLLFSRAFFDSTFFLCSSSSDLYFSASWTIFSISSLLSHVQDAVGVDVEANGDLGDAPRRRRDAGELELAQEVVVPRPRSLPLYVEKTCSFLVGMVVFLGIRTVITPPAILHLLVPFAAQDGGLDGCSVRDGLVGIDALAEFLPVEEVLEELLDLRDPSGAAHEDHVVDGALVHLGVPQALLHGLHALPEQIHVQLFESGPGDGRVEGSLRPLACCPQSPEGPGVPTDVLLVLPLEFLDEVVDHPVTSNVPPPRSKMRTFFSPTLVAFLSRPYAIAAAVGSLMIRITLRPAMTPASLCPSTHQRSPSS
ncbi:unnamed protein product [Spirodela intermedia]|uniref:Uncharacterized protein n=1 Tax=Spirodela intermedia TaxID=51605 RepID=A0A7I8K1M1_SPIIN|nr:unnamed protein product [Spirodela intermedia]